jgi:hypothetical protein
MAYLVSQGQEGIEPGKFEGNEEPVDGLIGKVEVMMKLMGVGEEGLSRPKAKAMIVENNGGLGLQVENENETVMAGTVGGRLNASMKQEYILGDGQVGDLHPVEIVLGKADLGNESTELRKS